MTKKIIYMSIKKWNADIRDILQWKLNDFLDVMKDRFDYRKSVENLDDYSEECEEYKAFRYDFSVEFVLRVDNLTSFIDEIFDGSLKKTKRAEKAYGKILKIVERKFEDFKEESLHHAPEYKHKNIFNMAGEKLDKFNARL